MHATFVFLAIVGSLAAAAFPAGSVQAAPAHPFRAQGFEGSLNTSPVSAYRKPAAAPRPALAPDASFTATTEEIQFTRAVKDKAAELNHDPLAILNFVKNEIAFAPYYGSKKGADATLLEREGNAFDQASLLQALLRAGDTVGSSKIPTRYQEATVKLNPGELMNLLGVNDPTVAAEVLSLSAIPYVVWVDGATGDILFFTLDHVYAEAWIDYGYSRGLVQGTDDTAKQWIPLDPSFNTTFASQSLDILEEMEQAGEFTVAGFYEDYLEGLYGEQKPLEALQAEVEAYLALNHPDLTFQDTFVQLYAQDEKFEFIPRTLPYEIHEPLAAYATVPDNLKHSLAFLVQDTAKTQTFLDYGLNLSSLAHKELVAAYTAATQADQDIIDRFSTLYDVVPVSQVNMKPVVKLQGEAIAGGAAGDPAEQAGQTQNFQMTFTVPNKEYVVIDNTITSTFTREDVETIENDILVGNALGIAVNLGNIVVPESRPAQDTATTEFIASQKLYRTALNYLNRLQDSQHQLSSLIGGEFGHLATRAYVFNGIDVVFQDGQPHTFTWKGLRIDSSSFVSYYNRAGTSANDHITDFLYVFGLAASLDESSIFEEDYDIESMSTVKGLRLINTGAIPGVSAVKITQANEADIDTLSLSAATKDEFHRLVQEGNTLYTPNSAFTYLEWTGLVYISLDPATGSAGYIIGEGLNGGYTAENWPEEWIQYWLSNGDIQDLTATIGVPLEGQEFTEGDKAKFLITYEGTVYFIYPVVWVEEGFLDTAEPGTKLLLARYGAAGDNTRTYVVRATKLGEIYNQFDSDIIDTGENYDIPPDLLKSLIHEEAIIDKEEQIFVANSYRYEAHRDYDWYSRQSPTIPPTIGWRGLANHPEKHFAVEGSVATGEFVPEGDQLPPNYLTVARTNSFLVLDTTDTNRDGDLTAAEIVANNPRQGWPDRADWNFTAQLVLAASYGLGQVMYETAVNRGFDTRTDTGQPAEDIYKLFDPEVSIDLSASHLKKMYDQHGRDWWEAVFYYNGGFDDPDPDIRDSVDYADSVMEHWNNGEGIYKPIIGG